MRAPTPQDWAEGEGKARSDATPPSPARVRTAAGTIPPGRRRHTAEEPIESGEIVERRSLVIRSSVQSVDWNEGPTEISVPALPIAPKRSWRSLWLAGAIVCGVAAVVVLLTVKPDPAATAALEARAEMIGATLDGEARAALVRADALASSPVLRAAIETDATTLADMARDNDVAFSLAPGAVIEVFQVRGPHRSLLLRLPEHAGPLDPPAAGTARIDGMQQQLLAVATAPIANERSKLAGEIVVSSPIDLGSVTKRLAEQTRGATITGLRDTIVLIASRTAPNVTIPITMKTPTSKALALAAVVPQPTAGLANVLLAVSLALVAVFLVLTVRARRAT